MNEIPNSLSQPPAANNQNDTVFQLFMKMFFYQGLVAFLPFLLIKFSSYPEILFEPTRVFIWWFWLFSFLGLLIIDNIGIRSSYPDRISRLVTGIAAIVGAIASLVLYITTRPGWDSQNYWIVISMLCITAAYYFMGWYFIRAEHGLYLVSQKSMLFWTMWSLLSCGLLLLLEFLVDGLLLIGMMVTFVLYIIAILKWGKLKVVPVISPKQITIPYRRATLYNFIIDMIKAAAILLTIIAFHPTGFVILFPENYTIAPYSWIRNLSVVAFVAAGVIGLFSFIRDKFHGLIPIIFVMSVAFIQYLVINFFENTSWWLISILAGIIMAGIYYFIEQKMDGPGNVRAVPGMFYMMVYLVFAISILIRSDSDADKMLENIKFLFSLLGIAYIFGYIREAPKQKSLRMSI